jgi:hypothetical protein
MCSNTKLWLKNYNMQPRLGYQRVDKAVPLQAVEALGGEEIQLLHIFYFGTRWG